MQEVAGMRRHRAGRKVHPKKKVVQSHEATGKADAAIAQDVSAQPIDPNVVPTNEAAATLLPSA